MTGGREVALPGAREIIDRGGEVWAGQADLAQIRKQCRLPSTDDKVHALADGDFVIVGDLALTALNTPGHTPGSICLFAAPQTLSPREPLPEPSRLISSSANEGLLITGDTLFVGSCGRTDLPGSDQRAMLASLSRLATLPPGVVVLPGHNYAPEPHTTVAKERTANVAVTAGLRVFPNPDELPPCCACAAEGRGPGGWASGRRVELHGIAGDIGRKLNGKLAVVLRYLTQAKRYEVRLLEGGAQKPGLRAAGLEAQYMRHPRPTGAM